MLSENDLYRKVPKLEDKLETGSIPKGSPGIKKLADQREFENVTIKSIPPRRNR